MADLRRALRRRRAAEVTVEGLIDTVIEFGTAVGDSVGKEYNAANARAQRFLKGYMTERVDMINSTTRKAVHKALKQDDPKAAVRKVFRQARAHRAKSIAETEVVRASNWGAIDAGKWVGDLKFKLWATQEDAAVRDQHRGMHHQRREWNETFTAPNGRTTKFPGGFGVAALDVGCRCSAIPSKASQQEVLAEFGDPVEIYDDVRKPHVKEVQLAWRKVFREQEAAVLEGMG